MATQDFQSEYWPNLPADSLSADPIDLTTELDGYVAKSGDTMTGPLVVPDATADGQALAYGQDSARLGNDTYVVGATTYMSNRTADGGDGTDQNLRLMSDTNTYLIFNVAGGDSHAIRNGSGGTLFFYTPGYAANPVQIDASANVVMTGAASVRVPTPGDGATDQAAQVTAKDSTTGQLQIGGVEMGDTGWRDVSSLLTDGWVTGGPGQVRMIRQGQLVVLIADYVVGTSATSGNWLTLPTGFRPSNVQYLTSWNNPYVTRNAVLTLVNTLGVVGIIDAASSIPRLQVTMTWPCSQAWPTSLPGTPV